MLLRRQSLNLHRGSVRGQLTLVTIEDLVGAQPAQVVGSNQEWKVGELLYEVLVIGFTINHQFGDAQPQGSVGGRTYRNPVVRFGSGRTVLGSDDHDLSPALHAFDEPMRVRKLVFHQVLAIHDDELGEAQVIEITVGGLQTMDPGVSRCLISMPGVVGPVAPAAGLLRPHSPNNGIQQAHGVVEPVHPVLPNHP